MLIDPTDPTDRTDSELADLLRRAAHELTRRDAERLMWIAEVQRIMAEAGVADLVELRDRLRGGRC